MTEIKTYFRNSGRVSTATVVHEGKNPFGYPMLIAVYRDDTEFCDPVWVAACFYPRNSRGLHVRVDMWATPRFASAADAMASASALAARWQAAAA